MKNKFIRREKLNKMFSVKLALIILLQVCWPTTSMALTGGPSQPEVQSFEPIGTSDMVDLFTGDFSYNIPLFDMDGYPMNISYHSGVGMDQEASWVGLGWNINPGVINRNMRGIPDDFSGDEIVKEQNVKKNQTLGVSCGVSAELFGLDFASFNARLGIKYNNYTGVGMERSFNVALSPSNKFGQSATISLGITSSSDDGLSLQPSISLGQSIGNNERSAKVGVTLGASFNSRGGLSNLTLSRDVSFNMKTVDRNNKVKSMNYGVGLGSSSFNLMQPTYSPNIDFPMNNLSITASLKFGGEAYGWAASVAPSAYYAEQGQATKVISSPAYGFMNLHNGASNDKAMLDFNREKDGAFTPTTFNLPITNLTYDIYSVSGQGTGGSYRPFRGDVGHVYDISSWSTSDGYSASVELGGGGVAKVGTDFVVNSAYSNSGDWSTSKAAENLSYQGTGKNADYEAVYFKEANERSVNTDPGFLIRYGGFEAVRPELDGSAVFDSKATGKLKKASGSTFDVSATGNRIARDKRNQTIQTLSNYEVNQGMGLFGAAGCVNTYITNNITKIGHHVGQITSLNTDGKRYVYALPAYNKQQQEITFAVGKPVGGGSARSFDPATGLVDYQNADISTGNKMGLDNYYSNTKMPPFAHSYLLSAVLSADYVDLTGNGPSDDDLGDYTLFTYDETVSDFNWRTPVGDHKAKFSEGLLADPNDDKGSIVYGTKQLFYLSKITTKNHIADFILTDRDDGKGVADIHGSPTGASEKKIEKIVLRTKKTNKPIKTVHFVYDYLLCQNSLNSIAPAPTTGPGPGKGKLTLIKLFFTYQDSEKGAYNAYNFKYGGPLNVNPEYNINNYDRWGNYKSTSSINDPLGCAAHAGKKEFFPYSPQDVQLAYNSANAWSLTKIQLPSGGEITVNYESDDYAYVQDKQATQMYFYSTDCSSVPTNSHVGHGNWKFIFDLPADAPANTKVSDFLPDNNMVFFKFKMNIANGNFDYVPGYAEVNRDSCAIANGKVSIGFKAVKLNDNNIILKYTTPFVKAAIQYGRLNTPRTIWDQPNASASIGEQTIKALANSSFFQNIAQTIKGPNWTLYGLNRGVFANLPNCCIKLKNVTGRKFGGGSRVASIVLNDNFDQLAGNTETPSEYGQDYSYQTTMNGKVISSGVAAYEPQIGGEENALKEPFFTETKHLLAPDDAHYTEAPFGESFYPSPTVGYSKVKVANHIPDLPPNKELKLHGTGYIVNEFYTARDFPTISERTELEAIQHKSDPFELSTLLSVDTKDHMTTSQGFYIELNDMHGKQKSIKVYNNFDKEISSTEYFYKSATYGNGSKRLTNNCTVINPNGGVSTAEVGVFFDAVGDLREQFTDAETNSVNVNVDMFWAAIFVAVVVPIPSFASDETQFRSATITKVVQRFGILDKTIVKKDGSTVTQKDLAYDAETGEVLLTQTANDFNDPIYNFRYPAYWYYGNMGAAYKNIGYTAQVSVTNGMATITGKNYFRDGDELELIDAASAYSKAWITKSVSSKIELKNITGIPIPTGVYTAKVIRSGARNMQTMDMANIQTLVNPVSGIGSNVYQKVVSAKAIEFDNRWNTNCDCISTSANSNPFTNGTAGNYRAVRNYEYLTQRGQTSTQNNSNIRVDGMFTTYTPFYKNFGGKWLISANGWTYASEVTEFNPYGQELENKDGLGRYSAATFGFNQSLATAVGANTRYRELGYESFEDVTWANCSDEHFKFIHIPDNIGTSINQVVTTKAHTGRTSLLVKRSTQPGDPYSFMEKKLGKECSKPSECQLEIFYNSLNNVNQYQIINGYPPYIIDVEKISGTGSINIQGSGDAFTVTNTSGYKCKVTVIDAKGCIYNKLIIPPYNN